jgi:hypothetical protein
MIRLDHEKGMAVSAAGLSSFRFAFSFFKQARRFIHTSREGPSHPHPRTFSPGRPKPMQAKLQNSAESL